MFGDRYMQYTASLLVSVFSLMVGYNTAWTSPNLEKLESQDSPIGVSLTLEEGSWMTSVMLLGVTVGNLGLGPLMDLCGRRGLLLISAVPICVGWFLILYANSFAMLVAARFVIGVWVVIPTMTSAVYIGEISDPAIRGKLGMFNLLMVEVGMVVVTALGSYTTYTITVIAAIVQPAIFLAVFFWMPESPYYYLRKGDVDNAMVSLKRLRSKAYLDKELLEMKVNVEKEMKDKSSFCELFRLPKYRKPVLIIIGAKTLQQMSGTIAINSYMKTIFNQVSSGLDPKMASVISTAVSIPSVLIGSYLVDKMGRKFLYYISTIGCAVALSFEFTYFFLQDYLKHDVSNLSVLPLAGIILFNIFRGFGIQTMPVILLSEVFPTNVKSIALIVTLVYSSVLAFIVTLCYPLVVDAWGIYFCFLVFMISCVVGLVFIYFVVPETKGKSFSAIQDKIETSVKCDK